MKLFYTDKYSVLCKEEPGINAGRKIMKRRSIFLGGLCIFGLLVSCDPFDFDMNEINEEKEESFTALEDVAAILSMVPLGQEQMQEVLDATGASAGNGYDEEYLMKDLFEVPGKGVGDSPTKAAGSYSVPLKELFKKAASEYFATTKAAGDVDAGEFLDSLSVSDIQIYCHCGEIWRWTRRSSAGICFSWLHEAVRNADATGCGSGSNPAGAVAGRHSGHQR